MQVSDRIRPRQLAQDALLPDDRALTSAWQQLRSSSAHGRRLPSASACRARSGSRRASASSSCLRVLRDRQAGGRRPRAPYPVGQIDNQNARNQISSPRTSSTTRSRRSTASRPDPAGARAKRGREPAAGTTRPCTCSTSRVRICPTASTLSSVKQNDARVQIIGLRAVQRARVDADAQHRAPPWLTKPELVEVRRMPAALRAAG